MDEAAGSESGEWLIDSYQEWAKEQHVPIIDEFSVDLRRVEVRPWDRMGALGAIVQVRGRGEYLDMWLLEIPRRESTTPLHHLFETVSYVISGHGVTRVESPFGELVFEWGPTSMFSIPINSPYQHINTSGLEPVRLATVTSCPTVMNLFHSEDFVFGSQYRFPERRAGADYRSEGRLVSSVIAERRQDLWETNFVPDLRKFAEMKDNEYRGPDSKSVMFMLGDSTMHAHMSEIPVGKYKKAHRHPAGLHIFPVTGRGYSLLWFEGDSEYHRVNWEHGICYAPPESMYHQHFNIGSVPARYLALGLGSRRYPFSRVEHLKATPEERIQRRVQIEYEDEDPRIGQWFSEALSEHGVSARDN